MPAAMRALVRTTIAAEAFDMAPTLARIFRAGQHPRYSAGVTVIRTRMRSPGS
jgi:hypothetical protein